MGLEPITADHNPISDTSPDQSPLGMGYVGTAMNGVAVQARASEDGQEDEPLNTLRVRSSSMMAGYLAPGGIDDSSIVNGWFDTGDLARTGEAGGIYLKGRRTEVINRGGLKVVPCEVEEALMLLPQVAEAKVYKGVDPTGLEFVKTAIVKDGAITAADVRAHCEKHLVFYKRPNVVLFVDSLPKTPSGKVILSELP
jgi:long-chain acyl-CoA synthetase